MEKDYEFGVDIWAVGLTFSELVLCSKPYLKYFIKKAQVNNIKVEELIELQLKERFLFAGDSSYPMSPLSPSRIH